MSIQITIPEDICQESKDYVRRIIEALGDTLTSLDQFAVEKIGYVHNTWLEAERDVIKKGRTQISAQGMEIIRPTVKIANDYRIQLDKFENTFGLNPKSRKEINKPKEKVGKLSPIDVFINQSKEIR
jgi:P27 family predicted phage terminase small subunit